MHDIDAQISKISGQQNYMESLQQITGNIMTVDMTMYKEKVRKISAADFNMNVLLKRLVDSDTANHTILEVQADYLAKSTAINIKDGVFVMKQRKNKEPKEVIAPMHLPSELVKSEWFKSVKHIEKEINKSLNKIFTENVKPSDRKWETVQANHSAHPELVELETVYDVKLENEDIFKWFTQLQKCANVIINNLMIPMYNVRATIEKHWDKIGNIFKTKAFSRIDQMSQQAGNGSIGLNDIMTMLEQFIIAKYRATVTGNNKHYAKLFLSAIGNEDVSSMDGARFLEIMDTIDLDKLDKNETVYKFAVAAKSTMKKIVNNENFNAEEMIQEMNQLFNDDVPPESEGEMVTEESKQYDDLI